MSHKRLVVACDGTWTDSDNGFVRNSWLPWSTGGHLATPSNVTRICRALLPRSGDGIPQIVYYQAGLGSMNDWYSYFIGGYLGEGISENIREAYAFLCDNYEEGDEIILLGFSRGAFTARSIGGLIGEIGLLTKRGLGSFYPVFEDWENQEYLNYKPQYGTAAWPATRPKFSDPSYVPKLVEAGLTRPSIPVKAVAVWDTVGALGVPDIQLLGLKIFSQNHAKYSFINCEVPANVEYAYQALALDEERKPYSPTVWESPNPGKPSRLKVLKQCWFPGAHASIGGGFEDTSIPDITLAWMVTQLSHQLAFDSNYVLLQQKQNVKFYEANNLPVASWAMGKIVQSNTGALNALLGSRVRTPGNYHATDPATGKPTSRKLVDTCEFVHPSVRYRIQQKGPGLAPSSTGAPKSVYQPLALKGWTYCAPNEQFPAAKALGLEDEFEKWANHGKWVVKREDSGVTFIAEESIDKATLEIMLLDAWGQSVASKVLDS